MSAQAHQEHTSSRERGLREDMGSTSLSLSLCLEPLEKRTDGERERERERERVLMEGGFGEGVPVSAVCTFGYDGSEETLLQGTLRPEERLQEYRDVVPVFQRLYREGKRGGVCCWWWENERGRGKERE